MDPPNYYHYLANFKHDGYNLRPNMHLYSFNEQPINPINAIWFQNEHARNSTSAL
jgi:hypothetical protein